jgi:hypothetical protein
MQTLAQAPTGHVAIGQRWPEKTPVQQAKGLAGVSMRTGQISHGRLVMRETSAQQVVARLAGIAAYLKMMGVFIR